MQVRINIYQSKNRVRENQKISQDRSWDNKNTYFALLMPNGWMHGDEVTRLAWYDSEDEAVEAAFRFIASHPNMEHVGSQ